MVGTSFGTYMYLRSFPGHKVSKGDERRDVTKPIFGDWDGFRDSVRVIIPWNSVPKPKKQISHRFRDKSDRGRLRPESTWIRKWEKLKTTGIFCWAHICLNTYLCTWAEKNPYKILAKRKSYAGYLSHFGNRLCKDWTSVSCKIIVRCGENRV